MKKLIKVHGWDVSLNHSAFVELIDGDMSNFWYVATTAGSADRHANGCRLVLPKAPRGEKIERQVTAMARLAWMENFMDKTILMPSMPDYTGIEDYAISMEQGSHYLGEIGGVARLLCWFRGLKFRLHDPISVKMFTTHNGTAQKDDIEEAVLSRWGVDFGKYNQPIAKPTAKNPNPKQNRSTSEDLADAYAIAQLIWTEVQLRFGVVLPSNLHPKEVQVFNRITKTYPKSLLDRNWIQNPEGTATPHGEPVCPGCGSRRCCGAKTQEEIGTKNKLEIIRR